MLQIIPKIFILAVCFLIYADAVCNKCGTNSKVACLSETEYKYCFDGSQPSGNLEKCPVGKKCIDAPTICSDNGTPDCISKCGQCNAEKKFACMSQTTFSPCYGTDKPFSQEIVQCPQGQYCKFDDTSGRYCTSSVSESTCLEGQMGEVSISPNEFCAKRGIKGLFPVPGDRTCQTYIACFTQGNRLQGQRYRCPTNSIFSPLSQKCTLSSNYKCP